MKTNKLLLVQSCRSLVILSVCVAASACRPALIYGERTSLHIASINLNDDVSEPLKLKVGFNRSLATLAPPRGGTDTVQMIKVIDEKGVQKDIQVLNSESVSTFSRFKLRNCDAGNFLGIGDTLTITTNFASGQAAINIADNPTAVDALLGVRTVGNDTPEVRALRNRLIAQVNALDLSTESDKNKLNALANNIGIAVNVDSPSSTRSGVIGYIDSALLNQLSRIAENCAFFSCS